MFCSECGKNNPPEYKFCQSCGAALVSRNDAPQDQASRQPAPARIQYPQQPAAAGDMYPAQPAAAPAGKKKSSLKWIIGVAAVLLAAAVIVVLVLTLGGGKSEPTAPEPSVVTYVQPTVEPAGAKPAEVGPAEEPALVPVEILADNDHAAWVAHGQYLLADGTENSWNGKDSALYEASSLTPIALEDVADIDLGLYNSLSVREVKYLYTIDLIFGTNDAGWTTNFLKDGMLYSANGSYAFKICPCLIDEGVYSEDGWIPDPKVSNAESLTPDTLFMPAWQEENDEYGFNWTNNPVVAGGPGLYTLVIAQYTRTSAPGQPGYGIGLVLKTPMAGIDYEEIGDFLPAAHSYGLIGSFEGSDWVVDVPMTPDGGDSWSGEITLKVDDEFKIRADGDWTYNWGAWGERDGANLVCKEAGTYRITIAFEEDGVTIYAEQLR